MTPQHMADVVKAIQEIVEDQAESPTVQGTGEGH